MTGCQGAFIIHIFVPFPQFCGIVKEENPKADSNATVHNSKYKCSMIGTLFCYFFTYLNKYNVFLDVFLWSLFSSYFLLSSPPCSFPINLPFMAISDSKLPGWRERDLLHTQYCVIVTRVSGTEESATSGESALEWHLCTP